MSNYKGKEKNFFTADGVRSATHSPYFRGIPDIVPIPLIESFDRNPDKGDLLDILGSFFESRQAVVD
ncbi:hypothetical protein EPO14_02965 [Patescibacteria group bacterium]|nr:MAG: hypothetical protein EPO14_02965 [Patescibacteria group bacterium]